MKHLLDAHFHHSRPAIEAWFEDAWKALPPPFYTSVDVRDAGFKIAPVDTNLYPGGWNNLSPAMVEAAVPAARAAVERQCSGARRLLLIPENHSRNPFYLANVLQLKTILERARLEVRLGCLDPEVQAPVWRELPTGERLLLEPLARHNVRPGHRLSLEGFDPQLIVLNNDLSAGQPRVLQGLLSQTLVPPLQAGWSVRRKTRHFEAYDQVAARMGELLGLDPWLLNPLFRGCGGLDFSTGQGLEALRESTDALLQQIAARYRAFGIDEKPFVVIKADNGTYGMGIMTVRSVSELDHLNRRTRNKMGVIKDGQTVREVILQEGVATRDQIGGAVAEPVAYLLGGQVVGGFYRVHPERGTDENLNAPGARFEPLQPTATGELPPQFYAASVMARLAALAASEEMNATQPWPDLDWLPTAPAPLCDARAETALHA